MSVECKNPRKHRSSEKNYIWNLATCNCQKGKYLESTIEDSDSQITCDKIIEEIKTVPTKRSSTIFYILLAFLLNTVALLTAVSIYFCFIKYRAKQKYLLPYHITNKKLKEMLY